MCGPWLIVVDFDRREDMKELRCMSFTSRGTAEILVAGEQDKMFVIDVNRGEVTKEVRTHTRRLRNLERC